MRKIYTCKDCKKETSTYTDNNLSNSLLFNCPKCLNMSCNTLQEDWANITYKSFDKDIEDSIISGDFNRMFPNYI